MQNVIFRLLFSIVLFTFLPCSVLAQGALTFDLKKPKKFEDKKLGSEKTGEKKFTLPRRFIQNTVTHYNWYFNANNKLTEIIDRAKSIHTDDYAELLPFYNYSLETISKDKNELDSVIYKTTAGILIHDLRNDWIDNLYLLMGQAYFFKNEFDSAYLTFQYINYAFAPKESDGYDIPIGSNSTEEGNAFSIATKENRNLAKKIISEPPSRNESLLWQIRTYIANKEMPEAAGLIETLRFDPNFPARLHNELAEMQSWWFYKQEIFDSAAYYLEKALPVAADKQEIARWEYLIAQLHERTGQFEKAIDFYNRSIRHTLNPVMEVYARLNAIRQNKKDSAAISKNLQELLKMARRDRYSAYRDIIYYSAAQMELERRNVPGAKNMLLNATKAQLLQNTTGIRTRAFMQLGDISYEERNYQDARRYYDSVNNTDPGIPDRVAFETKKTVLGRISEQLDIIYRQDSLQRIAGLPDAEREAFLRKTARELRRREGLLEKEQPGDNRVLDNVKNPQSNLFNTNAKGAWYFNNPSLKAKGLAEFKSKWGNRPNVDNWRVSSAAAVQSNQPQSLNKENMALKPQILADDNTFEGLLARLPLQPEQLAISNDSIQAATIALGTLYNEGLEDYSGAIELFNRFLERYPESNRRPEALFQLYYAYRKTGQEAEAQKVAKEIAERYPTTRFQEMIVRSTTGNVPDAAATDMQRRYDTIYNAFIEGDFDKAMKEKKQADSLYSNNYWTPQLLYIQSVHQIRSRQDDSAKATLQQIITLYPTSLLAQKAATMLDVVNRRKEIEGYLSNLTITRPGADSTLTTDTSAMVRTTPQQQPNVANQAPVQQPSAQKPVTKKDTAAVTANQVKPPAANASQEIRITYSHFAAAPHLVVVILDKVDPVYVSESRNAFNRYNKEKFYNRPIDVSHQNMDENTRLVVMSGFENAAVAMDYLERTRKAAPSEIIPWLPAGKYSFVVITADNLEILKGTRDLSGYRTFLSQHFPGKF